MKNNKKIMLTALIVALVSSPFVNAEETNTTTNKSTPITNTTTNTTNNTQSKIYTVVYIPSMMCGGCESSVKEIFTKMGIQAIPDYKTKKVILNKGITEEQAKSIYARVVLVTEPKISTISVSKEQKSALESKLSGKYSKVEEFTEKGKWGAPDFNGYKFTLKEAMSYETLYTQCSIVVTNGKVIEGLSKSSSTNTTSKKNNKDNSKQEKKVDVIYIPSMMCGGCEAKVKELFKSIGVVATPDHKTKKVVLDKKVSLKELDKLLLNENLKKKWPYVLEYKQEDNKNMDMKKESKKDKMPKTSIAGQSIMMMVFCALGLLESKKRR